MPGREPKVLLLDGNSLLYRAFFALPLLSDSKGRYTNAVYGFTMMLLRVVADERPTHIGVAFDVGRPAFRMEMYEGYKGTREKTPSELREQMPIMREVLHALSVPVLEAPGYEADDIIGTLSARVKQDGIPSVIVSGDKDLLQLVDDSTEALLTRKGITDVDRYDVPKVLERYGLSPLQIVDLKGLMGDTSDNIPGVPGVGEKTAMKLLQQFGSVETVLEHVDEVSGAKLQEKLREHAEQARLSKRLATILRDIPLDQGLDQLSIGPFDRDKVTSLFRDLEFKSLISRVPGAVAWTGEQDAAPTSFGGSGDENASTAAVEAGSWPAGQTVSDIGDISALWSGGQDVGVLLDFGADPSQGGYQRAPLHGVALSTGEETWYVPFVNEEIPKRVRDWFATDQQRRATFDLKAMAYALGSRGVRVGEGWFDVLLAAYLLRAEEGQPEMGQVVERELGLALPSPSLDAKGRIRFDLPNSGGYAAASAAALARVCTMLESKMEDQDVHRVYRDLELPLTRVLERMERRGVFVDAQRLRAMGTEFAARLETLTAEIHAIAGEPFNINSPKQLGEVLFEKLGLPPQKKTKTGYSTSADILEKLAPYHVIVDKILHFRQLGKLQSTYIEGLLKVTDPETSLIHTCFNQTLAATGRLSSIEPNLQNIPIRLEEGRQLRKAFVPQDKRWKMVSADYSQIELRVLAHISEDPNLCDAFTHDMDIHTRTASEVFEVDPSEVTSDMRREAKAVNFGIVYGISDFGLAQNLGITRAQAGAFIDNYFAKFPGVRRYMDSIVESARENGYVTTIYGRRRVLPDIHSRNFNLRSFAERTAMNTPIQGSAADIIKLAMVRLEREMSAQGLQSRLLLQVHDELIFESPEDELDQLISLVRRCMEESLELRVPLKVDVHVGDTWYDAK